MFGLSVALESLSSSYSFCFLVALFDLANTDSGVGLGSVSFVFGTSMCHVAALGCVELIPSYVMLSLAYGL